MKSKSSPSRSAGVVGESVSSFEEGLPKLNRVASLDLLKNGSEVLCGKRVFMLMKLLASAVNTVPTLLVTPFTLKMTMVAHESFARMETRRRLFKKQLIPVQLTAFIG